MSGKTASYRRGTAVLSLLLACQIERGGQQASFDDSLPDAADSSVDAVVDSGRDAGVNDSAIDVGALDASSDAGPSPLNCANTYACSTFEEWPQSGFGTQRCGGGRIEQVENAAMGEHALALSSMTGDCEYLIDARASSIWIRTFVRLEGEGSARVVSVKDLTGANFATLDLVSPTTLRLGAEVVEHRVADWSCVELHVERRGVQTLATLFRSGQQVAQWTGVAPPITEYREVAVGGRISNGAQLMIDDIVVSAVRVPCPS